MDKTRRSEAGAIPLGHGELIMWQYPESTNLTDTTFEAYTEFRRVGRVSYAGDENVIKRYIHLEIARKLSTVLNVVTGQGQNER